MSRIIISVIGKNDVGMAANICTYLAESNINILDITQTIVKEIFDMMMIVDIARAPNLLMRLQGKWTSWDRESERLSAASEKKFLPACTASKEETKP